MSGTHALESFAAGKADLQVETLQALAKLIFQMAEFDAERNLLRPANKQEAKGFIAAEVRSQVVAVLFSGAGRAADRSAAGKAGKVEAEGIAAGMA
jgi:hypothetical protein